jgi:[CysO sulfur-carrier protein]-S-L-cysteine hydrolase
MIAHALDGFPDEACGLLGGHGAGAADAEVTVFVPCRNADASSRTFSLGPDAWQAADRDIEGKGLEILGVVHSHTHTDAYPSPTDVEQAGNPFLTGWRWLLVSLKHAEPVVRSFTIDGVRIVEEPIVLGDR